MVKKKIVFILNNFAIGGTERFLLDLATELKSYCDIEIISVLGGGPLAAEFVKIAVPIHKLSPIEFYNKQSFPKKLFWVLVFPITLVRIVILLRKVKPDIALTSLWHADVLGILGARISGIKKRVLIQHDTQAFNFLRRSLKVLALRHATSIIANSEATKEFLTKKFDILPGKIKVIRIGTSLKNFKADEILKTEEAPTVGFIGRLEPVKGCNYFLEAIEKLKAEKKLTPEVVIAGKGSLKIELEEYSKNHNLQNVEFIGEVPDVEDILSRIDILVVPSREEGFGLIALEGLMAKKIVIASDIPVFRELIRPGENGFLFEVGNSNHLSALLIKLIETPELREECRKNTLAWTERSGYKYEIKNVAQEYLNFLSMS